MMKKMFAVLLLGLIMTVPVFAQQATKQELIVEYNRLEKLKQIILRQSAILSQIKILNQQEAIAKKKTEEEKVKKSKKKK